MLNVHCFVGFTSLNTGAFPVKRGFIWFLEGFIPVSGVCFVFYGASIMVSFIKEGFLFVSSDLRISNLSAFRLI